MLKRTVTAVICLLLFIPVLFFSNTWLFAGAFSLLAVMAIHEIIGCFGLRKTLQLSIPTYLSAIAAMTLFSLYFMSVIKAETLFVGLLVAGYIYLFSVFASTMFSCGKIKFTQAAGLLAMTLYTLIGFATIFPLRNIDSVGKFVYLLVFFGAWATDTGAYFVGMFCGKHKLIPQVSPKKTIEGAIGGIIGCVIVYVAYGLILTKFFSVNVNFPIYVFLAIIVSIVSQIGDLIASYVKRENNIKDYGFIFPGHGGVMDRFDSIIAVAPIIYIASIIFPSFS